jgi:8-oxo-dGTP pyrophosphatase MutT (NUDIX family)
LLFCGRDPHRPQEGAFWFTAGGGLKEGESFEQAARRELREETGLDAGQLREPVHERVTVFQHESVTYHQLERFYVARTEASAIDTSAFDDVESRAIVGHRWWTLGELETTGEVVYPEDLAALLGRVLRPGRSIT